MTQAITKERWDVLQKKNIDCLPLILIRDIMRECIFK